MSDTLKVIVGEWLRKIIAMACASWITWVVAQGIASTNEINRIIEIIIAVAVAAGTLLWSRVILPWIQTKFFNK